MEPSESLEDNVKSVITEFTANHNKVRDLLSFDKIVLDYAIERYEELYAKLQQYSGNPQNNGENTLASLKNIRKNESLHRYYEIISNQGIVLLISYITSALEDLFRAGFRATLTAKRVPNEVWDEEFKASFSQLVKVRTDADGLIDLVVAKQDIDFQDMGSTVRSFQKYLQVTIERQGDMDDIVFAQAARHAIVHNAAIADSKFSKQLAAYDKHYGQPSDRSIQRRIANGDRIQFSSDEVLVTGASMLHFVKRTGDSICATMRDAIAVQ